MMYTIQFSFIYITQTQCKSWSRRFILQCEDPKLLVLDIGEEKRRGEKESIENKGKNELGKRKKTKLNDMWFNKER